MDYRLDEIDKRVIYRLMQDARNTSAPDIASEVNVSPGTIRNRIREMEEHNIITGYHVGIDFERVEKRLTNLIVCTVPVPERAKLAAKVSQIPGVINVREVMTGQRNLHVVAVGTDMEDLSRISRAIASFDLEIDGEDLLQRERVEPYAPFGPENGHGTASLTDFISLAGHAQVVEVTVTDDAPIAGRSLKEANEQELLADGLLVVAIERDGQIITPHGETMIHPDDVVTVFSKEELSQKTILRFTGAE
ncbi:Lrp/AsnC family transcriptional regulator [Halomarina rubra]|uniref:TrkA C-terminal domain-containing protein n=1 Tax=Halomarina rubra TaxID=2071873 RepID=A0ABD6AWZ9_9EURY|nr:TrkA C-terminal domain-containing protein [Halomarina rubra]